jgi:hypothetical protein
MTGFYTCALGRGCAVPALRQPVTRPVFILAFWVGGAPSPLSGGQEGWFSAVPCPLEFGRIFAGAPAKTGLSAPIRPLRSRIPLQSLARNSQQPPRRRRWRTCQSLSDNSAQNSVPASRRYTGQPATDRSQSLAVYGGDAYDQNQSI